MPQTSQFTVLIENRRLTRVALTLTALTALALASLAAPPAHAARLSERPAHSKLAGDLTQAIDGSNVSQHRWAREKGGQRFVQAIIVSDSADPELTDLRRHIERIGGEVLVRHGIIRGLTVQVPAKQLKQLAQRDDVVHIAPNRATRSTASTLERVSGALGSNGRSASTRKNYTGLDGRGIGIAILDSGVERDHLAFRNSANQTRVLRNVNMLNTAVGQWSTGNSNISFEPGSASQIAYEAAINNASATVQDGYGHGTHVASLAAGFATKVRGSTPDITGIAPSANIYDVKVTSSNGTGTVSDAIEGIQWVVYNARALNIRVMNLSIAADSSDSWKIDPLCAAARAAVAAGVTVVAAAGNYGKDLQGREIYGRIGSPGIEPSVITVGAANFKDTDARGDDVLATFSSRGPTRGAIVNDQGVRVPDNGLKPDLVAPGNKLVGAASYAGGSWNQIAALNWAIVGAPLGITQYADEEVMRLSGTSVAAPVVAGAVALMLQANPGLTPPLIKAILQYSAQPLANASLVQQGAGLLNVDGALAMAKALRTDIGPLVESASLPPGSPLLAAGKALPNPTSTVNGTTFNWSRIVFAGGNQVLSGTALFTQHQGIWDPRLTWASGIVRGSWPQYWNGTGYPAWTYVKSVSVADYTGYAVVGAGVKVATGLVGRSSLTGRTGIFVPTATLTGWLVSGSGQTLLQPLTVSQGLIMSEGLVMSEGLILSEGLIMSEGLVMSEGLILSEGIVMSEGVIVPD